MIETVNNNEKTKQESNKKPSRFRLYIAYSILIPIVLLVMKEFFNSGYRYEDLYNISIFSTTLIPITLWIYWYLQIKPMNIKVASYFYDDPSEELYKLANQINEIFDAISLYESKSGDTFTYHDYIISRLINLPQKSEFLEFSERTITDKTKLSLFKITLENTRKEIQLKLEKLNSEHKGKSDQENDKDNSTIRMVKLTDFITNRLKTEVIQLTKRGNIYITFGSVITIIGGFILYMTVKDVLAAYQQTSAQNQAFTTHDLLSISARLSIIIFIEIFAYYYLRLYKNIMDNVKFYQNEITNMELKILALHAIENNGNPDSLKILVDELARSERNFVINKGQTTVDIERSKLDSTMLTKSVESIIKVIKSVK